MLNKNHYLASLLLIFLSFVLISAQDDGCKVEKTLKISELKGRVLFEYNHSTFAVSDIDISVSEKGQYGFSDVYKTIPDSNGLFEIKNLKEGSYYLSIFGMVGGISYLELEIVSNQNSNPIDNQIDFIFRGWDKEKECDILTIKPHDSSLKIFGSNITTNNWENITEIVLDKKGCYGSCYVYKITLRKDGTASYETLDSSRKKFIVQGEFQYGFERIAELLYRQGFFNLKDNYAFPLTDLETVVVSAVRNSQTKSVTNYGGAAPVELWAIQEVIDSFVDRVKWKGVVSK